MPKTFDIKDEIEIRQEIEYWKKHIIKCNRKINQLKKTLKNKKQQ